MSYKWIEPARPVDYKESSIQKALKEGPLYVMPKADGVRMHIFLMPSGEVFIRSRANLPFPAMWEIEQALSFPRCATKTPIEQVIIECEAILVLPDGNYAACEVTSGALQRHEQLRMTQLRLAVFDCHSESLKGLSRSARMWAAFDYLQALAPNLFARQGVVGGCACETLDEVMEAYRYHRDHGYEGSVAVKADAPYCSGKKVGAGWKIKPDITVDGIVTGLLEEVSKAGIPTGMVGSLLIDYEDGTSGKAGPGKLTDDERRDVWNRNAAYIGRCIEVKAMERFAKGGLRHPGFNMWRDTEETKGVKQ